MSVSGYASSARRPLRILLAEDDEADAKIALRAFEKSGASNTIQVVRDGVETLDYLYGRGAFTDREKFVKPDLVLLDLNMPRENGFSVITKLKADPAMREIPIVIMSTSRQAGDVLRAYQAGAASFLPKPADYPEFLKLVEVFCAYWHGVSLLPGRIE